MTRTHRAHPPVPLAATALATLLALAACSAGAASPEAGTASPSGRPSQGLPALSSPGPSDVPVTGEVPAEIIDAARAQLAEAVGADAATTATIVVAEAVTWPDGSLGCPEPGMMYTQQLVPGYRLVFQVDGASYDFRASEGGELRRCDLGGPRAS